jgi:hypothetical protein
VIVAQPEEPAEGPASDGFLSGLVRWVVELVAVTPEKVVQTPLSGALRDALSAMKLTGDPIASVVETSRGRPVRYEAANKTVFINTSHASVKALKDHPSRVLFLLAAAVSEVNRELEAVTDAEELAVIVDLLRDG